ncbi:BnaC07g50430D [Brassica napus]|uniref:BnaC07g50430D protein n=2 Tax=Brassica napus TaxID=3708 RepID=A0A078J2G6_BRANA|nr:BnaC07g50430D [Brassica napus]
MLPRRPGGDSNVVRVGGFILPCPSPSSTNRSSPFPDFSSHLVDF